MISLFFAGAAARLGYEKGGSGFCVNVNPYITSAMPAIRITLLRAIDARVFPITSVREYMMSSAPRIANITP